MGKRAEPEKMVKLLELAGRKISVSDFSGDKERSKEDFRKALRILSSRKIFPQPNYLINE